MSSLHCWEPSYVAFSGEFLCNLYCCIAFISRNFCAAFIAALTLFFSHSSGFIVSENSCSAQFFFRKNCIESSMSSASSMAIRQFHSWLDPSKIDPKTHLWCENYKRPRHPIDTCWQIHDSSSSTNLSTAAVSNTTMCNKVFPFSLIFLR